MMTATLTFIAGLILGAIVGAALAVGIAWAISSFDDFPYGNDFD